MLARSLPMGGVVHCPATAERFRPVPARRAVTFAMSVVVGCAAIVAITRRRTCGVTVSPWPIQSVQRSASMIANPRAAASALGRALLAVRLGAPGLTTRPQRRKACAGGQARGTEGAE